MEFTPPVRLLILSGGIWFGPGEIFDFSEG